MVYSMPKSELDIILEDVKNSSTPNEVAVAGIAKVLRGNDDSFKTFHIVEEVWSLKEALKHFSLAPMVGVIKDGLAVVTVESVTENTKLFPLPQTGLTNQEIDNLISLLKEQNIPTSSVTIQRLESQKHNN